MDSTFSSYDVSEPYINLGTKDNKAFNFFMFIILLVIFFIMIIPWNKINVNKKECKENMSGGTLTQLFAQDSQDTYLNPISNIQTGNYTLFWNQPTRVANTFQNRGSPLSSLILPDTSMNPNPYALQASNSYYDNILNKEARPVNFTNPVLSLGDVLPVKNSTKSTGSTKSTKSVPRKAVSNTKAKSSDVRAMESSDSSDYSTVRGVGPESPDYLTLSDSCVVDKNLSTNSVPTIPDNILPSSLPMPMNPNAPPNPYELANVAKKVATKKDTVDNLPPLTQWKPVDYLYQGYYNNLLYNKNCLQNPASCALGSAGGFRLGEDFNEPTKAHPYVQIDGNAFYPDSYVGSYWTEPNFDISRPIPIMLDKDRV
jgi:hypothetical protein